MALLVGAYALSGCSSLSPDDFGVTTSTPPPAEATGDTGAPSTTTTPPATEADQRATEEGPPLSGRYVAEPVGAYPHDLQAFTEGLEYHDGLLLESVGHTGESDRRWVDPITGELVTQAANDAEHFGEGITVVDDIVIQLTWNAGVAIIAERASLAELDRFTYTGEGWGLCYDGTDLYMSNGSDRLTRRDPTSFAPTGEIPVTADGEPVTDLNELECVAGQIVANVWGSDELVVINPTTGVVEAIIDAAALRPPDLPITEKDYALNGIAHNPDTGRWYLTGKWWPVLYEVEFVPER